jgi:hypothetical protein
MTLAPAVPAAEPLILAHHMPWYEVRPQRLHLGWHWTMNAFDPDRWVAGSPDITSHYHDLIGPFDFGEVDLLEYHALLMRFAGIDGIVADWYGREEYLDYASNHRKTAKPLRRRRV